MIIAIVMGIIGNLKQDNKFLIVYIIIVWSLFISFWIIFGVFLNRKNKLDQEIIDLCTDRISSGFTSNLKEAYATNLATAFCSANCPCASDKSKFPTSEYGSSVFNPSGASNIMDCPKSLYTTVVPKDSTIKFLRDLEKRYECSGLCTREKWFYFNDVDKGPPLYSCEDSIINYLAEKFIKIYGIVLTCAIITFFAPIPAIAMLCIKSRTVYFHIIVSNKYSRNKINPISITHHIFIHDKIY